LTQLDGFAKNDPAELASKFSMHSFGVQFAEVRVDPELGTIRVSRFVTVVGAGKIINTKTARSQLNGGVISGIGMALLEETLMDKKYGRVLNADLAEYHVPVHADIPLLETAFIDEDDFSINPIGAKGIGEISIVGVAAAVANAVYHATGVRVRDLPITLDKVLT
jgi:xanthine dehydrogenase YagR molybdenum-binding subunit